MVRPTENVVRLEEANVEEEAHLADLGVDGMVVTKCVLLKLGVKWTGLIWFGIETSGGLLSVR
jgi:hypothetical protein